jgi:hypothetical protein
MQTSRSGLGPAGLVLLTAAMSAPAAAHGHDDDVERGERRHVLRFNPNGKLKIVQFTDTQDGQDIDPRTVALIEAVLDTEKPDLVVFTGDQLTEECNTPADVKRAIDHIARPVDQRRIPWLITFGNHDEDHTPKTGVNAAGMLELYRAYPFNINRLGPPGVTGTGNMNAVVLGSHSDAPVFNVWAIDSGRYAPEAVGGQAVSDDFLLGWSWMPHWDWIRADQVQWYLRTSERLEHQSGRKIPSLMFFHIPLQEFRQMYENDAARRAQGSPLLHGVVGERNEDECPGPFNSGLFAAALHRGDVRGIFVGHDHINDYAGNYYGITLGYSANTGFGTYGLEGPDPDRLRGARVFVIDESDPWHFETRMVRARDSGIR